MVIVCELCNWHHTLAIRAASTSESSVLLAWGSSNLPFGWAVPWYGLDCGSPWSERLVERIERRTRWNRDFTHCGSTSSAAISVPRLRRGLLNMKLRGDVDFLCVFPQRDVGNGVQRGISKWKTQPSHFSHIISRNGNLQLVIKTMRIQNDKCPERGKTRRMQLDGPVGSWTMASRGDRARGNNDGIGFPSFTWGRSPCI